MGAISSNRMGSIKREPLIWVVTDFDGILSYEGLNIFAIFFLAHVACIHSFYLKKDYEIPTFQ